jgi:hypothetical protein
MPSEAVKMVALHKLGGNGRGKPEAFVTPEMAQDLVDAGQAEWNKKMKFITRTKLSAEMFRPAPSLKPNIMTMDKFVEGDTNAVAIIESWRYTYAA